MADAGVATWTAICFILVLCATAYFTYYYVRPGTPPLAIGLTFVAWLCPFSVCYLVPIDLLQQQSLDAIWSTLFWISFLLMWFIIPFMSGYYDNGEFTIRTKIRASVRFNLILIGVVGLLALIFLITMLATGSSLGDVAGMAIMASNIWGLIMLVVSAGYGLVEIPRELWHRSNLVRQRDLMFFNAAAYKHDFEEVKDEVIATFKLVHNWQNKIQRASTDKPELQTFYQQICNSLVEKEVELAKERGNPTDNATIDALNSIEDSDVNEKSLAKLNYHVISTLRHLSMVETQMRDCINDAISYDDAVGRQHDNAPPPHFSQFQRLKWYLTVGFRRQVFIASAVICATLSASILFAEITIPTHTQISPLLFIVQASLANPLSEQIFTCIPISYLSLCAYYPLFKIRLSTFYCFGKRRTDENTLLFNATLLLRMSVPLAYNFVKLLQIDATSLQNFTGKVPNIPFFGSAFNDYFPICMAVVSFLTLVNVSNYILGLLGRSQFDYRGGAAHSTSNDDGSDTTEGIQEGRALVNEQRRKNESGTSNRQRNGNEAAIALV